MEPEVRNEFPTVLFTLAKEVYGITAEVVTSFVRLENVHSLPDAPAYIRGILNLRGSIIPLLDLRTFLGMRSMQQDTQDVLEMLENRKQDHINWLNELEASVEENRMFRLTTDPHACAFGKWYDAYHTDDINLRFLLDKFAQPHERIHAVASRVEALQKSGQFDKARGVIRLAREGELRQMLHLFASLAQEMREGIREIVMVADFGDIPAGLVIDEILSIEHVRDPEATAFGDRGHYTIAKREKDDSPVILLEPDWLFSQSLVPLVR